MTQQELQEYIIARIYPNNAQEITGEALQSVLLEIVENAENKEEALATIEEIRQEIATKANKSVVDDLEQKKVDKIEGKGLSTNDFTNKDKEMLQNAQPKLISGENIKTYGGRTLLGSGDLLDEFEPAPNEIFYTNGSTTEPAPFYSVIDVRDANGNKLSVASHLYDWNIGFWVIKFNGDIIKISTLFIYQSYSPRRIVLPEGIKIIDDAFDLYSLRRINIPTSVVEFDRGYYNWTHVERVDIKDKNAYAKINFYRSVFENSPALLYLNGEAVTEIVNLGNNISDFAFDSYKHLKSLTLNAIGCETIGNNAFANCTALESVTIGSNCETIGNNAFANCKALESVTIGTRLKSVDSTPFQNCTGTLTLRCTALEKDYTTDTAPDSLGNAILQGSNFSKVIIDVPVIGANAFYKTSFSGEVQISSGTTVRSSVFSTASISKAMIGDNVKFQTAAGKNSSSIFYKCENLSSVEIGDIKMLCGAMFLKCTSLKEVTIPQTVTSIQSRVFEGCTSLKRIYCLPTTPPSLSDTKTPSTVQVVVPATSLNAYKTATNWSTENIVGTEYIGYRNNELFPALLSLEQRLLATDNNLGRLNERQDDVERELALTDEAVADLENRVTELETM